MPTGSLPKEGADLHKKVYDDALSKCTNGDKSKEKSCAESAAKQAWGAVKQAGWKKGADGTWMKSDIQVFSLRIERASFDKATQQRRWRAVASDTQDDLYNDNMTLELFNDFIHHIKANDPVPEEYRSSFWSGGMPYLSVSHYMDLDGKAVPGTIENVFVDGHYLKGVGTYNETPLGTACFNSVCSDLYGDGKDRLDKVRISIAFLDYMHKHKSNGYIYDRSKDKLGICPECLAEIIAGERLGKEFMKGQLIHWAHTRVPVNERTSMEVERAMPKTRKDDAESIIGKELAEELESESALVGKSLADALVIKADEDEAIAPATVTGDDVEVAPPLVGEPATVLEDTDTDEDDDSDGSDPDEDWLDDIEEAAYAGVPADDELVPEPVLEAVTARAVTKAEGDCSHPSSHYLIVEDSEHPTTWHLRIKNCQGEYDRGLAGAAHAALYKTFRGHAYGGPNKSKATSKLHSIYNSQGWPWPEEKESKADIRSIVREELMSMNSHPLDTVIAELKAKYDELLASNLPDDEKLRSIQAPVDVLGQAIIDGIKTHPVAATPTGETDVAQAITKALQPITEQLTLLTTQLSQATFAPQPKPNLGDAPVRRSLQTPGVILPFDTSQANSSPAKKKVYSIQEAVNLTTN